MARKVTNAFLNGPKFFALSPRAKKELTVAFDEYLFLKNNSLKKILRGTPTNIL
jgi:hypothetical protein